jgi:bla regulator protein blaR1
MVWRSSVPGIGAAVELVWICAVYGSPTAPSSQAETTFDVASVKPNAGGGGRGSLGSLPGGRFHAQNQTVRSLIQMAYHVQDFQISAGPGWINSERYDVEAKAEGNPPRQQIMGPMLQALLGDRFKLKLHRETKELPIYVLVAAKGGLQLKPAKLAGNCAAHYEKESCAEIRRGPYSVDTAAIGMEEFTGILSLVLGRVVIDQTGFKGLFDAHLEFTPEEVALAGLGAPPGEDAMPKGGSRGGRSEDAAPYRPSISRALQEQLGLRLESTKGPVEILVVDRVDRPTVN